MNFFALKTSIFLLALVFFSACASDAPSPPPDCATFGQAVMLIDSQLMSRLTVEDFQASNRKFKLTQIRSEDVPAQGKCELYSIQTVNAAHEHHGVKGDMVFSFFNNQLKQVLFYPKAQEDSTKYLTTLCEKEKICLTDKETMHRSGATIRKGVSSDARFFIVWEDLCLIEQMNNWLAKCS
jgi:hypothetical protein